MTVFLAFEGIDGSGKTTQMEALAGFLRKQGRRVLTRSYPVYESFFGQHIGKALSASGVRAASEIDAESMALWYALDRWHDFEKHKDEYASADFVLFNRYTLSSIVYQSLRSDNPEKFEAWGNALEHTILALPRPHMYIIVDVPISVGRDNVARKGVREYTEVSHDVYESDSNLQSRAREKYREFALSDSRAVLISSMADGQLLEPERVFSNIIDALRQRELI